MTVFFERFNPLGMERGCSDTGIDLGVKILNTLPGKSNSSHHPISQDSFSFLGRRFSWGFQFAPSANDLADGAFLGEIIII
ncbi:MAG: hypothetical protein ABJF89_07875 [Parasphingorhabdus sp.]|uniref:hypothetical protein n=1 Tax=Parasphingorhabdus sp. TaxID=2709688 RepID=UPI003265B672